MNPSLPIETLIRERCAELSLRHVDLVRLCGFRNEAKGLRRLKQLFDVNLETTATLLAGLPGALRIVPEIIDNALVASLQQLAVAKELARRANFRPHAVILTERSRPEPIWLATVLGGERLPRVDFSPDDKPVSYVSLSLEGLRQKLKRWNGDVIPAYGRPIGIVVNYSPDNAVRFDLEGNAIESLNAAWRPGEISLSIGHLALSAHQVRMLLADRCPEPGRAV